MVWVDEHPRGFWLQRRLEGPQEQINGFVTTVDLETEHTHINFYYGSVHDGNRRSYRYVTCAIKCYCIDSVAVTKNCSENLMASTYPRYEIFRFDKR